MKQKSILLAIGILLLTGSSFAQRMDLTGGTVSVGRTETPDRALKDTSGSYGNHSLNIHVSLPLFGNREKLEGNKTKDSHVKFYQTSIHAGYTTGTTDIGVINQQRNFYSGSAGLGGLFYNGQNNIIQADANLGFSADQQSFEAHDVAPRFSGSFIIHHTSSPTLSLQYGAVFTYVYGRPMLLPVFGIRKKFSGSSWSVSGILPLNLQVTDRLNKNMGLSFFIRPSGDRFQIQNQNYFNSTATTLYMGLRQFEAGSSFYYRLSKSFSFDASAGYLTAGTLKFTDASSSRTSLYQTGISSGAQFKLSLRYHLPHKRSNGNNIDMDGELFRVN